MLPNTVKAYTLSLNVKTKTDDVDAGVLARMGLDFNTIPIGSGYTPDCQGFNLWGISRVLNAAEFSVLLILEKSPSLTFDAPSYF
ncbi:MAG: hypothetical protein K9J37_10780 [Saprospiraceae bacterium]|nr:hypothetical protein [Saprospiraceae bacterium]MCF8250390.1 hypothetical protein [Saprospiraceae bacterium]MCF8281540.1 hypothetical protein [Bacteroidales bacterium]MCF8312235.1 hypothetical protein [Saprospiraceae bacterium]MCF8440576.1 hypothetical protein [Saprospiraceae bacterium]